MKKLLVVMALCLVGVLAVGTAFAYNLSYSPEFIRTQSRNASTDVDAAIYNPAGLVKLQDGLFINVANSMAYIKYSHTEPFSKQTISADTISWLTPDFNVVYKQDKWAAFVNMFVIDGGAALEYKDSNGLEYATGQTQLELIAAGVPGAVATTAVVTKAQSGYGLLAFSYGASYALTDMVAFSAGLRNFYYFGNTKIEGVTTFPTTAQLKLEQDDKYWATGAFIGLNLSPLKDVNVGISYQTKSVLYGETESKSLVAGTTTKKTEGDIWLENLPAYLALGVAYDVMPDLKVQLSYTLTFEGEEKYGKGAQTLYLFANKKNSHAVGLGAEYKVNDMIKASGGVLYSTTADVDETQNPYSPGLDKVAIGVGAAITAMPGLTIDLGLVDNIFMSQKSDVQKLGYPKSELKKSIWGWGIGVTYKAM